MADDGVNWDYVQTGSAKSYDDGSEQPPQQRIAPTQQPLSDSHWDYIVAGPEPGRGGINGEMEDSKHFNQYLGDIQGNGDKGILRGWTGLDAAAGKISNEEARARVSDTRINTMREQRVLSYEAFLASKNEAWKGDLAHMAEILPTLREMSYGIAKAAAVTVPAGAALGLAGGPLTPATAPAGAIAGMALSVPAGTFLVPAYLATGHLYMDMLDAGVPEDQAIKYAQAGGAMMGAANMTNWNVMGSAFKAGMLKYLGDEEGKKLLESAIIRHAKGIGIATAGNTASKLAEQTVKFLAGLTANNEAITPKHWGEELTEAAKQGFTFGMAGLPVEFAGGQLGRMAKLLMKGKVDDAAHAAENINDVHGYQRKTTYTRKARTPQTFNLQVEINRFEQELEASSANPEMQDHYKDMANPKNAESEMRKEQEAKDSGDYQANRADPYRLAVAKRSINRDTFGGESMSDYANELKKLNETGSNELLDAVRAEEKRLADKENEAHTAIMGDYKYADENGNVTGINPKSLRENILAAYIRKKGASAGIVWNPMNELMAMLDQWNSKPNVKRMVDIFDTNKETLAENHGINEKLGEMLDTISGGKRNIPLLKRMSSGWVKNFDHFKPGHGKADIYSRNEAGQLWMDSFDSNKSAALTEGNGFDLVRLRAELEQYLRPEDLHFARKLMEFNSKYADQILDHVEETQGYRPEKNEHFSGLDGNQHKLALKGLANTVIDRGDIPGALQRKTSAKALPPNDMFFNAIDLIYQIEPIRHFAGKPQEALAIFQSKRIRDLIEHRIKVGKNNQLKIIDDAIEDTIHNRSDQYVLHSRLLQTIRANIGPAWTNANFMNFFKQSTGAAMVMSKLNAYEILQNLEHLSANRDWYAKRLGDSYLKESREGNVLLETKEGIRSGDVNKIDPNRKSLDEFLGGFTSAGDMVPIDIAGAMVYKKFYDTAKKEGLSEQQAHEAGITEYERFGNENGQSSRLRNQRTPFERGEWGFGAGANAFFGAFSKATQQQLAKELNSYKFAFNAATKGKNPGLAIQKAGAAYIATHTAAFLFQGVQSAYTLGMAAALNKMGLSDEKWTEKVDEEAAKMAGAAVLGTLKDIPIAGPFINSVRVGFTNLQLNTDEKAFGLQYIPYEVGTSAIDWYDSMIKMAAKGPGEGVTMKEILTSAKFAGTAAVAIPGQLGRLPYNRMTGILKDALLPQPEHKHRMQAEPKKRSNHKNSDGAVVPTLSDAFPQEYQCIKAIGDYFATGGSSVVVDSDGKVTEDPTDTGVGAGYENF